MSAMHCNGMYVLTCNTSTLSPHRTGTRTGTLALRLSLLAAPLERQVLVPDAQYQFFADERDEVELVGVVVARQAGGEGRAPVSVDVVETRVADEGESVEQHEHAAVTPVGLLRQVGLALLGPEVCVGHGLLEFVPVLVLEVLQDELIELFVLLLAPVGASATQRVQHTDALVLDVDDAEGPVCAHVAHPRGGVALVDGHYHVVQLKHVHLLLCRPAADAVVVVPEARRTGVGQLLPEERIRDPHLGHRFASGGLFLEPSLGQGERDVDDLVVEPLQILQTDYVVPQNRYAADFGHGEALALLLPLLQQLQCRSRLLIVHLQKPGCLRGHPSAFAQVPYLLALAHDAHRGHLLLEFFDVLLKPVHLARLLDTSRSIGRCRGSERAPAGARRLLLLAGGLLLVLLQVDGDDLSLSWPP
mmetsp:Transcript_35755/g.89001  ORF Transcript_35755/g.89001 Transcript_35755/m.89001 type:complete len:417 (+) Transcript_35755:226-1476(+)